jgi:CTP synthase
MRLGAWPCRLSEGSLAREIYSAAEEISERHRHRYEFNPAFREKLEDRGLVFSGVSPDEKFVEIVELARDEHPWFLACQFHPEFKSKPLAPHPLFASFVRAAFQNRLQTETSVEKISEPETAAVERAAIAGEN